LTALLLLIYAAAIDCWKEYAMMNSVNYRLMMTISALCVLPFFMTGECRGIQEEPIAANNTTSAWIFPSIPIVVDDSTLDQALKSYSPFVLDCWEAGCRPCQLIDPKIDQMAFDFKGKIVFGKLCIDDNPYTASRYSISRTPTLLVFNNRTLVYKHVGNYPLEELEHIILTVLHMR
jgi:thioredoxin 1